MTTVKIVRPPVILKDFQNNVISTHDYEFQAVTDAEDQVPGTYTVERPTATIIVEAS